MYDTNVIVLKGRLCADPILKTTPDGKAVAEFRLASRYDNERSNFVGVSAFGREAENVTTYVKKGDPVIVEGSLRSSEWTAKDGSKRSKIDITASSVRFLSTRKRQAETEEVAAAA